MTDAERDAMVESATSGAVRVAAALMGSADLPSMADLAGRLAQARGGILSLWAELYLRTFGAAAYFAPAEFRAFFGAELEGVLAALHAGDSERLGRVLERSGSELAAMGVPFGEMMASVHLFEESCLRHLSADDPVEDLRNHRVLDRLSHIRIGLLAEAYLDRREAVHAAREAALERDVAQSHREEAGRAEFGGLVGSSLPMQVLYNRLETAARSEAAVLLVGESGTGKELAARAIHVRSSRADAPFVPVNCAALSPSLLESELFGHRRGAFTGALSDSPGLLRFAHGGTLFLDEVTEMSAEGQAKLLRAIQEKAVRPVGELREIRTDFRVVASTNRSPDEAVRAGKLRPDLLYRLRAFLIDMPPLSARIGDLPLLARAILDRAGLVRLRLSPPALQRLRDRAWPGNVRELEAVLLAAAAAAPAGRIRVVDLPRPSAHALGEETAVRPGHEPEGVPTLRETEARLVRQALAATRGNKRRAAMLLGVSRKWLYAHLPAAP